MPDVDGIEVLRHVRQNEALSNIPVVSELHFHRSHCLFEQLILKCNQHLMSHCSDVCQ